jgi:hypothetical protein
MRDFRERKDWLRRNGAGLDVWEASMTDDKVVDALETATQTGIAVAGATLRGLRKITTTVSVAVESCSSTHREMRRA